MPCFSPRIGFRHKHVNPETGKRAITYSRSQALHPIEEQILPCGQCMHCRLKTSRDKGLRVALEAQLYSQNSFITLTYSPQHLPPHGFLDYDAPVQFMYRLREKFGPGIRSFGCAEYGENFSRPHYHICLLNFDFSDKKRHGKSTANFGTNSRTNDLYISKDLEGLWPFGLHSIGSLTLESAAYVARYCTKKISGAAAKTHYEMASLRNGEILTRPPEKAVSVSRQKPGRGLGYPYYEKYGQYVRDHDRVTLSGRHYPVPVYFDKLTEEIDPDRFEEIKNKRRIDGIKAAEKLEEQNLTSKIPRLDVLEMIQELKFTQLKRGIENV